VRDTLPRASYLVEMRYKIFITYLLHNFCTYYLLLQYVSKKLATSMEMTIDYGCNM